MKKVTIERNTNETQITIQLNLDGTGQYQNQSGCGFLDHMLDLFTRHGRFDLQVSCKGIPGLITTTPQRILALP